MDYYDDMDHSMVPERDASMSDGFNLGDELLGQGADDHHGSGMAMKTSMAAFNQQRTVVAKLSRGEIEDRYLRLLEENVVLKKHAVKQEEKIKKLATKLIRVMSDKKRLELGGPNASNIRGHRDLETEELIEDQQQRIRELERGNSQLKDKLMVAKQQILAIHQQNPSLTRPKRSSSTVPRSIMGGLHSPQQTPSLLMPSPTPTNQHQLLSQQAQQLLEEARNENRMLEESVTLLKEQVNMLELEVEQTQEQAKIKEANYEEELSILKEQLKERNYQDVAENIELIRLQQDKKAKAAQLSTTKAQIQALEEEVAKYKAEIEKLKAEVSDLSTALGEEQRKAINLTSELTNHSSSKQALTEAEEKMRDLQKENAILRESNAKLLDSAYNVERERQFAAAENALKVQVAQLEATLKADLNDKKLLSEALANERETSAKNDAEFQDLQARYFSLKEAMEGHEEKLKFFADENSIDAGELEQALMYLRQKSSSPSLASARKGTQVGLPEFLESTADDDPSKDGRSDAVKSLQSELSQVQAYHVEAVNELEKTRSLLRVQANINQEQRNEIEALQQRLFQVKAEFQNQIGEYKKLLDMRAARIHKLEMQVRDNTYGQVSKQINVENLKSHTLHTPSGQSLFELHVQKVNLTKESLSHLGTSEPKIFATWTFYHHDMQYTPVIKGPQAVLDCSAYYKVKLDDAFLDFLMDSSVTVEIHMTSESTDCKSIGQAELKLTEVVHYPSNKLHGSVLINSSPSPIHKEPVVIGSLDFWFKLHTAATSRIQEWLDHRQEVERVLEAASSANLASSVTEQIELLKGEQSAILLPENHERLVGHRRPKPPTPELEIAPEVTKSSADSQPSPPKGIDTDTATTPQIPEVRKRSQKTRLKKLVKSKEAVCEEEAEEHKETLPESGAGAKLSQIEPSLSESRGNPEKEAEGLPKDDSSVKDGSETTKEEEAKPVPKPRGPIEVVSSAPAEASAWDNDDDDEVVGNDSSRVEVRSSSKDVDEPAEAESSAVDQERPTRKSSEESSDDGEEEEEDEEEEDDESGESESESGESSDDASNAEAGDREDAVEKKAVVEDEDIEEEEEESSSDVVQSTSTSSAPVKVKQMVKEDSETTLTGESSSTTQDSEGVVVRKDDSGNEAITITISEFKAGKNANFLKNKKIQKIYVEYSFLDLKPEETETPFALPKPKASGESIVFNFSKVIPMDKLEHSARRKLLAKILSEDAKEGKSSKKPITFSLVSEPEESEDGKCEDVGTATVDLEALYKSDLDLVDAVLDVHSVEPQTRVSKFLGAKKIIGTLTVSVLASDVFKSLKL